MKNIAILTSGGDAPGMNAAVAAVIKTAFANNIQPWIVQDGYKGLITNQISKADIKFADSIVSRGGTVIGSARLPEFKEEKVREVAVKNLKKLKIEALVVIGGDGSYQGAEKLSKMGINCIGLPGTIDNDIVSSDLTIGFDTALNTVVNSIDAIRDTADSHNRCMVVEIMGNACGDLTLFGATATGAEVIATKESPLTKEEIISQVNELKKRNHRSVIVAVSEKQFNAEELAKEIMQKTGYDSRHTVLGHIQRGGKPTAMERYWATRFGIYAVEQLIAGKSALYIGLDGNTLVGRDIESTLNAAPKDRTQEYDAIRKINKGV
ncbi:6-phosphofructokinase [Spiroplasma sp. TIUS-1]|uniref:6-phosphofructokinase n=1 Tax=Spiroplasma sp. TIUS-1 TaxID=216963 RepID=UPI001396D284|nr:6-phosphofructokinase [Spiroplasma sp. TIUS-1]QHX36070.1 6-phosphofructokinase [Spiroplasma sp. TIUS-1]